ncbi:hypothetical protein AURDEDRAFT_170287 [Auricularia subglabra TFB-10046 SS5]|nr:hypothetical protein AURDEDRAFT_170287 [Auricularia subglabra TFB-10046 SS5]
MRVGWRNRGLPQNQWRAKQAARERAINAAWRLLETTNVEGELSEVMHRLADLADVLFEQMGCPDVHNRLSELIPLLLHARADLRESVEMLDTACERLIDHIRHSED